MLMFLVKRGSQYLKSTSESQYPEWTHDIHEAYHFDQHAVHEAFELAELYAASVYTHDLDTDVVSAVVATMPKSKGTVSRMEL